jgi:hypothetical protein
VREFIAPQFAPRLADIGKLLFRLYLGANRGAMNSRTPCWRVRVKPRRAGADHYHIVGKVAGESPIALRDRNMSVAVAEGDAERRTVPEKAGLEERFAASPEARIGTSRSRIFWMSKPPPAVPG